MAVLERGPLVPNVCKHARIWYYSALLRFMGISMRITTLRQWKRRPLRETGLVNKDKGERQRERVTRWSNSRYGQYVHWTVLLFLYWPCMGRERHAPLLGRMDQGGDLTLLHLIDPRVCVGGGGIFQFNQRDRNNIINYNSGYKNWAEGNFCTSWKQS